MSSSAQSTSERPAPPKSRTATLIEDVRRTPLFRQLVPQEAGVGWPLPARRGEHVYFTLPLFGMGVRGKDGEGVPLYAPFATLTLLWPTGQVVHYRHLRHDPSWSAPTGPVGAFPHPAVTGMPRGKYLAARAQLLSGYDILAQLLAKREPLPQTFADKFGELLGILAEPGLVPYYRQLAPDFVGRFLPQ